MSMGPDHQVRFPDRPPHVVAVLDRLGQVGRITLGGSVVHPGLDQSQLPVVEGLIVLEFVDPYLLLDERTEAWRPYGPGWPSGA